MSHFHRKASNSLPPAPSDKVLAVHMVDKAQKKMNFYPELICVDHDNGHWCLQICACTHYPVQVNPVPRHDTAVSFIFFSFPECSSLGSMYPPKQIISCSGSVPPTPLHYFIIELTGCKHEWILRVYAKWDKSITEEQILLKSPVVKSNK